MIYSVELNVSFHSVTNLFSNLQQLEYIILIYNHSKVIVLTWLHTGCMGEYYQLNCRGHLSSYLICVRQGLLPDD